MQDPVDKLKKINLILDYHFGQAQIIANLNF